MLYTLLNSLHWLYIVSFFSFILLLVDLSALFINSTVRWISACLYPAQFVWFLVYDICCLDYALYSQSTLVSLCQFVCTYNSHERNITQSTLSIKGGIPTE